MRISGIQRGFAARLSPSTGLARPGVARLGMACLGVAIFCLTSVACDSPTDPLPETIFFEGSLEFEGTSSHDLMLEEDGLVEFVLQEYLAPDPETGEPTDFPAFLGFVIGRPAGPGDDPEISCVPTGQATLLSVDIPLVLRLDITALCVRLFDSGVPIPIPEEGAATYRIRVRSTE